MTILTDGTKKIIYSYIIQQLIETKNMFRLSKKDVCPHIGLNIIGVSSKGTFDMKCVLNYDDYETMKSV